MNSSLRTNLHKRCRKYLVFTRILQSVFGPVGARGHGTPGKSVFMRQRQLRLPLCSGRWSSSLNTCSSFNQFMGIAINYELPGEKIWFPLGFRSLKCWGKQLCLLTNGFSLISAATDFQL